jgi:HD-like signal output (HDOD) protein
MSLGAQFYPIPPSFGMTSPPQPTQNVGPYTHEEIRGRVEHCPKLASLQVINNKLASLVKSDKSGNAEIAALIRHDPSLTARLLRMVNSVYFGLSAKVNNIDEAVLYLGLRQIRELSMATPVIEDMAKLSPSSIQLPWREMWQHSIGTAIMTREVLATTNLLVDDDTDYIVGLLHNVGKVVLATAWSKEFAVVAAGDHADADAVCAAEREAIGWDHAEIGAYYLERHQLAPEIVEAVRFHANPQGAGDHRLYAAAVQVADLAVREAGIVSGFERVPAQPAGSWARCAGWKILFEVESRESAQAQATLERALVRLPGLLNSMV